MSIEDDVTQETPERPADVEQLETALFDIGRAAYRSADDEVFAYREALALALARWSEVDDAERIIDNGHREAFRREQEIAVRRGARG